jgi:hypothetical protein
MNVCGALFASVARFGPSGPTAGFATGPAERRCIP